MRADPRLHALRRDFVASFESREHRRDTLRGHPGGPVLHGLPEVFDVRRRKWVDVKAAPPESIAAVIDRCPSGALRYVRKDADSRPASPSMAVVRPSPDGPLRISGTVRVESEDGTVLRVADAVALCRCGGTANPPFCDGTHSLNGFRSKR